MNDSAILTELRRYWGYDSFRPMQERIVGSLLAAHDTCVIMPTGGGKSLCYQLPAVMQPGQTGVVISPLIALMQDQVAQLKQMGISAAFLNSSLAAAEQTTIVRNAVRGEYRLLYLSPERIAREDTSGWLARVPLSFFVIDEAHCISEWGHEFRPEYRKLSSLRKHFPDKPIAAFTASATRQVRHDVIAQLQLRNPDKYIASFHRKNLRYVVKESAGSTQPGLLIRALRSYHGSNSIVYAPTIARVEETVELLEERGIPAVGYHGRMDQHTRTRNQERWMADEVRVLVGTLAFGLGINKPAVRAVIHLSLPKSVEQYYQEAGRAGRDGEPADCVLLWQRKDVGLLAYFNEQVSDPDEKARCWQRYRDILRFVEAKRCRHLQICEHFGETPKWSGCGACDVCGYTPVWFAEPTEKKKKPVEAKRTNRADRADWASRQRWADRADDEDRTEVAPREAADEVSTPAKNWWGSRTQGKQSKNAAADVDVDPELREALSQWRRAEAKEQGVAAFVVLHDSSINELCRVRPANLTQLRNVPGFGERKTARYGDAILGVLQQFRAAPPK